MFSVHFTLKGQDFEKEIKPKLEQLISEHTNETMVDGFMPTFIVKAKGFDPSVCEALDLHPFRRNFYSVEIAAPLRYDMIGHLALHGGTAYFIGNITEGVQEEWDLCERKDVPRVQL